MTQNVVQPSSPGTTGSIVLGVLMILSGLAAISLPFTAALALTFWIGWLLIGNSILTGIYAFQTRPEGGSVVKFLLTLLYLAAGLLLVFRPLQGVVTLTLLLGTFLVMEGISELVLAFQLRSRPNWEWVLFNGILTLIVGIFIWTGWPLDAPWVIGTLVGLSLMASGISRIMLSIAFRNHLGKPIENF